MNKYPVEQVSKLISVPIDVLFGCISYEQRCLAVPSALTSLDIKYPLYFSVEEFRSASSMNEEKLKNIFRDKLKIVKYSSKNPVNFVDGFITNLNSILINEKSTLNITVDISTFTRESLVMLIGMLYENRQHIKNLDLIYSPASTMSDEWLSRGFRCLRSVLGFPGERSSLKPLHIVVMTGFELERAKFIIDEYEPELISIGIGDCNESIKPEFYERNKRFVNELVNHYETRIKQFSFSLINPVKVLHELDEHIKQFSEYNTVLAPLNNKISTVGATLYCLKNTHVQICYLPAEEYNTEHYSKPDVSIYLEKLDFGVVSTNSTVTKEKTKKPVEPLKSRSVSKNENVDVEKLVVGVTTKPEPVASVPDVEQKGLKDPKTGEVATAYGNYRFTKRWIKEALVAEKLVDKVYKNDELNAELETKIKAAILKLKSIYKYRA